ncbi:MAG: hypothetical protein H0T63_02985 [Pyrinomonadaceae bacterium]|nr:hypothetical protein [Pyrinomonadaceae bacterium]
MGFNPRPASPLRIKTLAGRVSQLSLTSAVPINRRQRNPEKFAYFPVIPECKILKMTRSVHFGNLSILTFLLNITARHTKMFRDFELGDVDCVLLVKLLPRDESILRRTSALPVLRTISLYKFVGQIQTPYNFVENSAGNCLQTTEREFIFLPAACSSLRYTSKAVWQQRSAQEIRQAAQNSWLTLQPSAPARGDLARIRKNSLTRAS